MKKYAVVVAINILLLVAFMAGVVAAQSGQVTFLGSAVGTTVTNCGTPTTPSICGVATGYFVWQSAASGWVLIGAAPASMVTSFNGQSGAITYTPPVAPVLSVNGKTGTVVIAATTTLQ